MNSPVNLTTDVFTNSVVGCGFLEWNSPIGVPLDAWWTIVSMVVFCVGCKRIHSHDGHSAHLNIHGQPLCGLPIDKGKLGITEVSDPKGKGKAHELWWSVFMFPHLSLNCYNIHLIPYLSSPNTNPEWLSPLSSLLCFFFFFFPLLFSAFISLDSLSFLT